MSLTHPSTLVSPPATVPGRFGAYGGRYVPETLMAALLELEDAYAAAQADPAFHLELDSLLADYAGRPTPLYFAKRMTEELGGARIYLKREDLLHTGAHKINNCIGQGLLARRMGKQRIIAETGAGQHGVATATVCALFGMDCVIYMGEEDMRRQELNVYRMRLLGADVRGVSSGSSTLKDAINEAMRDWGHQRAYDALSAGLGARRTPLPDHGAGLPPRHLEGSAAADSRKGSGAADGDHRLRRRWFERHRRVLRVHPGRQRSPDRRRSRRSRPGARRRNAARFKQSGGGSPGVLQGTYSYVLQDEAGQIALTHSVSAGLDYASVGPEHAALHDSGRAEYVEASDEAALKATVALSAHRGHYSGARIRPRHRRGHAPCPNVIPA